MTEYCTVADVKLELQIAPDDLTYDEELEDCVTSGSALVDGLLNKEGLTVPDPVPQNVKDATACFAAWRFRERRDPAGAEVVWVKANRFLDAYIQEVGEVGFKVCQA